jgi:thiamine biosynthesis lipoprotein ApbE
MTASIAPLLTVLALASTQPTEPVRMSASIAGEHVVIEVRDLERSVAERVIRQGFEVLAARLRELSRESPEGALARLNQAAGKGPTEIDPALLPLLTKSLGFCVWSRQAHGPLGGELYDTWSQGEFPPSGEALTNGLRTAACSNLQITAESSRISLSAGARVDLRHFAAGDAVDQVTDQFLQAGVTNAWVAVGDVVRAVGPGPSGRGWQYQLPLFAGMTETLDPIWLQDKAVAAVSAQHRRFRFGDLSYPAFLDQRTGQPASGVQGALIATERALDAQALATTMMITGNREGQLRLAAVEPSPAALWLLGDDTGEPLINTYKWSVLSTQ